MKEFIKKHWKTAVIIILVLALIWFVVLPRYNLIILQKGYDLAYSDLSKTKSIPLSITQGNETKIIPVNVCSEYFQLNYKQI